MGRNPLQGGSKLVRHVFQQPAFKGDSQTVGNNNSKQALMRNSLNQPISQPFIVKITVTSEPLFGENALNLVIKHTTPKN